MRLPVPPGLETSFPAAGWYWVPAGSSVAVFLAADAVTAALSLHQLAASEDAAAS